MARTRRRSGNLPAEATSFVGRRRKLTEVRKRLAGARLVSLVGPGGVGKSRLALRAATDLARGFADGAWLVEVAEVRDPALVSNAVMTALDLRDQAATEPLPLLLAFLKDRELLLVLDNCEHLLEAVAQLVTYVIGAGAGVRVIATSREPLSISGEHVVPVPPLELPTAGRDEPLHQLRQNEAVTLFVERAAAASGQFELTESNQAAVTDVCRRLDGLPLAIELAAVRTRVLSIEQILERLTDRFGLLTGGSRAALPRQQTLRTTIDWSYDLLSEHEQTLFRALCVFAGRFTLEDIEAVCGPGSLDRLSSLVDRSLAIKEDAQGAACYRLHETIREYAALRMRKAGEEEDLEERCLEHYHVKSLGSGLEARYRLPDWLEWMDLEIDNFRAVLRRCVEREDFARGLDIATSVGWYWITRATTEGVWWLDQFLAAGQGNPVSLAWAHFMRGFLAVLQSDASAARDPLARAASAARELEMPSLLVQALTLQSITASMEGDPESAARWQEEAAAVASGMDDEPAEISVLQAKCLNGLFLGEAAAVRVAAAEGVRLAREWKDSYALGMMLMNEGYASLVMEDTDGARRLFAESIGIAHRIDDRIAQYALLDALGYQAARAGQARVGAQLLGAADSVRKSAGARLIGFLPAMLGEAEQTMVAALGKARFEAEFEAGTRMSRDEAIGLALGAPARTLASTQSGDGVLGKRESEVAQLVAEGLSNKQIGARLFISERTVATHVGSILNKLGFNSRAQIAAWVSAPGE
jgi:predicted ATPase/DNA-binding CsgD family transcriptional regulator